MIDIQSVVTNSPEHNAANALKDLISACWPKTIDKKYPHIKIISSAKCYGQQVRDIDLLLFAEVRECYSVRSPHTGSLDVPIGNLCLTIEVKSHNSRSIRFIGNQVEVLYNNKWHNASEQSEQQQISVRNYLARYLDKPPYVVNLIWLRGVPQSELPQVNHNILGNDATWEDFLSKVALLQKPWSYRPLISALNMKNYIAKVTEPFTKIIEPSRLDRLKMENITKSFLTDQQYSAKLGEQLLIFRGKGGTGKTVRLLQLAHELYLKQNSRVLILTYNKALVADLSRLLALMNITDGIAVKSIYVQTIHSFLRQLLDGVGVLPRPCNDYLTRYESYKAEALYLTKSSDFEEITRNNRAFTWDFILIDESQDWPTNERDLLFRLYKYQSFILADGIDQLVRRNEPIDWRENINRVNSQVVPLHKVLRLKWGLCVFVKAFAQMVGIDYSDIEPYPDISGGRVIVVEGNYAGDKSLHEEIIQMNEEDGNEPVDMLFCVPPELVDERNNGESFSLVGDMFRKWGYSIWDGTSDDVRGSHPTELEQHRIVQYDSCRGLEGWVVVNFQLDKFFDYKVNTYEPSPYEAADMFFDRTKQAKQYALRWLMIPLTRAMDTLVLQVSDSNHFLTKVLRELADRYNDIVEWRTM